jgi:hypothetical protein
VRGGEPLGDGGDPPGPDGFLSVTPDYLHLGVSLAVIGIGVLAAATTLFTAVTAFPAITGTTALTVAAWHWHTRPPST